MAAPLLASCGSVEIKDVQFCSPIPGGLGAVCDNFLTSNQLILDEIQWTILKDSWQVVECTSYASLADMKAEVEKLCSVTKCTYEMKKAIAGLNRILAMRVPNKSYPVEVVP